MSRFLDDATQIFEAASGASDPASSALTILVHEQGQIHIVDGSAAPIESLQAQHGCRTAFRVTRNSGRVRVEGRDGLNRCLFEKAAATPAVSSPASALGVFCDRPLYSVAGTLALR